MPHFLSSADSKVPLRVLDVRPDDTDARDYIFQPSLTLLPAEIDNRGQAPVLNQGKEGACVGFALATVINVSLTRRGGSGGSGRRRAKPPRVSVSPRMLYEMGRRYDEWAGENYEGTSLRGAMKGWHKHGVTDATSWPYTVSRGGKKIADRQFTPERAQDALRRPIGAYYRIIDSDVGHVQAAVDEADAVLASAWIHPGWRHENLGKGRAGLRMIGWRSGATGLHAFAIVGYTRDGFIIQNSWGRGWSSRGCALLPYDEWFEKRQDAWAARPGPETRDSRGEPKIFVVGFGGGPQDLRAGTAAAGLDLDPRVLPYLINTGDRGALSSDGQLATPKKELPAMAQLVLTAPQLSDGARHIILYAHGGLNAEGSSAVNASRLWSLAERNQLRAYFFLWESGIRESVLGWLKSDDDASGPARFSWQDAWEGIKSGASAAVRQAQRALGGGLAPIVREVFWDEMKGRAAGASAPNGGAALFVTQLFKAIKSTPNDRYKVHLVGHSAGSIYLGLLYKNAISSLLPQAGNVTLASIHMMAPAITIARARECFLAGGSQAVPHERFLVHNLKRQDEENDSIQIYPSSLLTYVADHLEDHRGRVPLLGIRSDFDAAPVTFATQIGATTSVKHGEFDDRGHEVEEIVAQIGPARF